MPDLALSDIESITACAHRMADRARVETLRHFRKDGLDIEDKGPQGSRPAFDPVTEADRAAEQAMRACLSELRPDDAILGEEFGVTAGTTGLTWVLDPIDGTRGFMSGSPTWGVLIAVEAGGHPVYGLIDQPFIGERFEGGLGRAQVDGPQGRHRLATRGPRQLEEATVVTTFPEVGDATEHAGFHDVAARARLTRYGMDCYGYALLAAGQIDLVIEAGLAPYDIQAPIAVIEAAGGLVTNWSGGSAAQGGRVVAGANPAIHAAALEILAGYDG